MLPDFASKEIETGGLEMELSQDDLEIIVAIENEVQAADSLKMVVDGTEELDPPANCIIAEEERNEAGSCRMEDKTAQFKINTSETVLVEPSPNEFLEVKPFMCQFCSIVSANEEIFRIHSCRQSLNNTSTDAYCSNVSKKKQCRTDAEPCVSEDDISEETSCETDDYEPAAPSVCASAKPFGSDKGSASIKSNYHFKRPGCVQSRLTHQSHYPPRNVLSNNPCNGTYEKLENLELITKGQRRGKMALMSHKNNPENMLRDCYVRLHDCAASINGLSNEGTLHLSKCWKCGSSVEKTISSEKLVTCNQCDGRNLRKNVARSMLQGKRKSAAGADSTKAYMSSAPLAVHGPTKRYDCKNCLGFFKSYYHLRRHERTHSRVKRPIVVHTNEQTPYNTVSNNAYNRTNKVNSRNDGRKNDSESNRQGVSSAVTISVEGYEDVLAEEASECENDVDDTDIPGEIHNDYHNVGQKKCSQSDRQVVSSAVTISLEGYEDVLAEEASECENDVDGTDIPVKNNNSLNSIMPKEVHKCQECGEVFKRKTRLKQHMRVHSETHRCKKCGDGFSTDSELQEHNLIHSDLPYECDICGIYFATLESLQVHSRNHEEKQDNSLDDGLSDSERSDEECEQAARTLFTCEKPYYHQAAQTSTQKKSYHCKNCQSSFKTCSDLRSHILTTYKHNPENVMLRDCYVRLYDCMASINGWSKEGTLHLSKCWKCGSSAERTIGSEKSVACNQCDSRDVCKNVTRVILEDTASCTDSAKAYMCSPSLPVYGPANQYDCEKCLASFKSNYHLRRHERAHSRAENHRCALCDLLFVTSSGLKKHMVVHTSEQTPNDTVSNNVYNSEYGRTNEVNAHEDGTNGSQSNRQVVVSSAATISVEGYEEVVAEEANECENDVDNRDIPLENHTSLASIIPEEVHKCQECDEIFKRKTRLKQHMRVHSETHKCEKCGDGFSTESELQEHNLIHSDLPYECDICGVYFAALDALQVHSRTHEEKQDYSFDDGLSDSGLSDEECELSTRTLLASEKPYYQQTGQTLDANEKPYHCENCPSSFKTGFDLRNHSLAHIGTKPYGCSFCGTWFASLANVKTHLLLHRSLDNMSRNCNATPCTAYPNDETLRRREDLVDNNNSTENIASGSVALPNFERNSIRDSVDGTSGNVVFDGFDANVRQQFHIEGRPTSSTLTTDNRVRNVIYKSRFSGGMVAYNEHSGFQQLYHIASVVPTQNQIPNVISMPDRIPTVASMPNHIVVSTSNQIANVVSTPIQIPNIVSMPNNISTVASMPNHIPNVVSTPNQIPIVVPMPEHIPTVVSMPNQIPNVVSTPNQIPIVVPMPEHIPTVVSIPNPIPNVVSTPNQIPAVVCTPNHVPTAVPTPNNIPSSLPMPCVTQTLHSKEKPYHCENCPSVFKTGLDLRNHSLAHIGTKLYDCSLCGTSFTSLANLKAHLLADHLNLSVHGSSDQTSRNCNATPCNACPNDEILGKREDLVDNNNSMETITSGSVQLPNFERNAIHDSAKGTSGNVTCDGFDADLQQEFHIEGRLTSSRTTADNHARNVNHKFRFSEGMVAYNEHSGFQRLHHNPSVVPTQNQIPNVISMPDLIPTLVSMPNHIPNVVSTPNRIPNVVSTPNQIPNIVSMPNHISTVASMPNHIPNVVSTPDHIPNVVSTPDHIPTAVSMLNQIPNIVSTANQIPNAVSMPNHIPNVVSTPDQIPNVVFMPDHIPTAVSMPNHIPNVVATLNQIPNVVSMANHTSTVVSTPNRIPSVVSVLEHIPTVVSTPNQIPAVVCTPNHIPTAVPAPCNIPSSVPMPCVAQTLHAKENPYHCENCPSSFKTGFDLRNHCLVHIGTKPYVCSFCGTSFASLANVKGHLLLHISLDNTSISCSAIPRNACPNDEIIQRCDDLVDNNNSTENITSGSVALRNFERNAVRDSAEGASRNVFFDGFDSNLRQEFHIEGRLSSARTTTDNHARDVNHKFRFSEGMVAYNERCGFQQLYHIPSVVPTQNQIPNVICMPDHTPTEVSMLNHISNVVPMPNHIQNVVSVPDHIPTVVSMSNHLPNVVSTPNQISAVDCTPNHIPTAVPAPSYIPFSIPTTPCFTCIYCHTSFSSESDLQEHCQIRFFNEDDIVIDVVQRIIQEIADSLENHTGKLNFERCKITNCERLANGTCGDYDCVQNSTSNILSVGPQATFFECTICGVLFSSKSDFQMHIKTHSANNAVPISEIIPAAVCASSFECTICKVLFSSQSDLQKHGLLHSGNNSLIKELLREKSCNTIVASLPLVNRTRVPTLFSEEVHKCRECGEVFSRKIRLQRHMHVHSETRKCEKCGDEFSTESELQEHNLIHTDLPYECDICGVYFSALDELQVHSRTHEGKEDYKLDHQKQAAQTLDSNKKPYQKQTTQKHDNSCDANVSGSPARNSKCDVIADRSQPLVHNTSRNVTLTCSYCSLIFTLKECYIAHVAVHVAKNEFKCTCGVVLTSYSDYEIHSRTHSEELPLTRPKIFKCDECDKAFTSKYRLKDHMDVHIGKKLYNCHQCDKPFATKFRVAKHFSNCHAKIFTCEVCGKRLTSQQSLRHHNRIHTGERPFKCIYCDKAFITENSLKEHCRRHTGDKRYKCEQCGAAFVIRKALRHHAASHSKEKPFMCEICGAAFSLQSGLRCHRQIHTGEKPHKCEECEARFLFRMNLTRHMRVHTGERPFKCAECGSAFTQKEHLKKHLRTMH